MADRPAVTGLFETHLLVSDLGRSIDFYRDVVGLPLALEAPERNAAFFWVGDRARSMLGLWAIGSAPMGMVLHVAFEVGLSDVLSAPEQLRSRGVTPLSFFGQETHEPTVIGWMPAAAVYFLDPDRHQLEYLSMLAEPPRPEAGVVPYSKWAA
jgi:lactoylglutathione lyase